MSYTLPPITLTENQTSLVTLPGTLGSVSYLKLVNASPYLLAINNLPDGSDYMQPGEANVWAVPGLSTAVQVTPLSFVSNTANAPSSVLVVTWFLEGEQPEGNYPVNFNALYFGGNVGVPSNSIEQDMWTPFILGDTITPSHTGNVYQTTTGVAFLRQSDNSLLRISANATSQTLNTPSSTYYHDLNPDGSFSLGTTHSTQPNYLTIATIVINASGNITTLTDTRVRSSTLWNGMTNAASAPGVSLYNLHVFKDIQADDQISVQGSFRTSSPVDGRAHLIGPGSAGNDLQVTPQYNDALTSIAFWVNPNGTPPLTAVSALWLGDAAGINGAQIDSGGVIHAPAPVQLISGHQETGSAGFRGGVNVGGDFFGGMVNFKTVLTNTPTSITLAATIGTQNVSGAASATQFRVTGFLLQWGTSTASNTFWLGTYTTVGNCLLTVDTHTGTFDHHCDACGHISTATSVSAITHSIQLGEPVMSYSCPACGATEAFNTALSAADEADMTPQGSGAYATTRGAQATLIRALMTALGLEVAA